MIPMALDVYSFWKWMEYGMLSFKGVYCMFRCKNDLVLHWRRIF